MGKKLGKERVLVRGKREEIRERGEEGESLVWGKKGKEDKKFGKEREISGEGKNWGNKGKEGERLVRGKREKLGKERK